MPDSNLDAPRPGGGHARDDSPAPRGGAMADQHPPPPPPPRPSGGMGVPPDFPGTPARGERRRPRRSSPASAAAAEAPTIFHEEWWLDAASGGTWEKVEVEEGGTVVGVLPFLRVRRYGAVRLVTPHFTRTLGPRFVLPASAKPVTRVAALRSIVGRMIERLPRHDAFRQLLAPTAGPEEALAFALNGWPVQVEYTFRFPARTPPDDVWRGMEQKTRNLVATSRSRCEVEWHADVDRFEALTRRGLAARGIADTNDYPALRRILEAGLARDRAAIASARGPDGREDAASVALVWDRDTVYLWNTARDPAAAGAGALSLLVWEACNMAHARGLGLDLDGFSTPAAGRFLATFGAAPAPRPLLHRMGNWAKALSVARAAKLRLQGRTAAESGRASAAAAVWPG